MKKISLATAMAVAVAFTGQVLGADSPASAKQVGPEGRNCDEAIPALPKNKDGTPIKPGYNDKNICMPVVDKQLLLDKGYQPYKNAQGEFEDTNLLKLGKGMCATSKHCCMGMNIEYEKEAWLKLPPVLCNIIVNGEFEKLNDKMKENLLDLKKG